jgi:hypothetical protein
MGVKSCRDGAEDRGHRKSSLLKGQPGPKSIAVCASSRRVRVAWKSTLSVAGGLHRPRDRQHEFDEREQIPRAELGFRLRHTLIEADRVLARLDVDALLERRQARGEEVTVSRLSITR